MLTVIFTQGLPGAGKSSWSKKFCEENQDYVRVSRDDLRRMRGKYWIPEQEPLISMMEQDCLKDALLMGKNVILDATNFNEKFVEQLKNIAKQTTNDQVNFEFKVFDTPLEECIRRDALREKEFRCGEKIIRQFYDAYLKPKPIVQDPNRQHAIICDLDGTLAFNAYRNIYDYSNVKRDVVNRPVWEVLRCSSTKSIILFVSGRDDICYEDTMQWLKETDLGCSGIGLFQLYMRKTGDKRPDFIVKKEIFDQNIKDKFYIDFVLDDRNQVVKMWRELGLTCFQVAEGNF